MPIYVGVGNHAKLVKNIYAGINGHAKIIYSDSDVPTNTYIPYTYVYRTSPYALLEKANLTLNTYTQIICDFKVVDCPNSSKSEGIFFITDYFYAHICNSGNKPVLEIKKGANSYTSSELTIGTVYTIILNKNTNGDCYFGNTKIFSNTETISTSNSIKLFKSPYNTYDYNCVYIKGLYGYSLTENKNLFDLRPCILKNGTIAGVYDLVSKTFIQANDSSYKSDIQCTN